jgi:hypothetical protein
LLEAGDQGLTLQSQAVPQLEADVVHPRSFIRTGSLARP